MYKKKQICQKEKNLNDCYFRVYSANVCLSTQKSPMNVKFEVMEAPAISGMLDKEGNSARSLGSSKFKNAQVATVVDVHCLPLFTLLAALDFPTVDFFSLDVEGAELGILQTIPWHQVNIVLTENRPYKHAIQTSLNYLKG